MLRAFPRVLLGAFALAFAAFGATACTPQKAASPPATVTTAADPADADAMRAAVREVLTKNPELVEEALAELERRREVERRGKIEGDTRDFVLGPRNAPVTVVEFFDYRCPYCHAAMDWVLETNRRNPQTVRIIFKEFPVLGETSVEASQAAGASIKKGRYLPFHRAIMAYRGQLDAAQIDTLARSAGIDVARMRRDMEDASILDHLQANHEIAAEAKIDGTPAFLINGKWVRGWNQAQADQLLADALRDARKR